MMCLGYIALNVLLFTWLFFCLDGLQMMIFYSLFPPHFQRNVFTTIQWIENMAYNMKNEDVYVYNIGNGPKVVCKLTKWILKAYWNKWSNLFFFFLIDNNNSGLGRRLLHYTRIFYVTMYINHYYRNLDKMHNVYDNKIISIIIEK